MECPTCKEQMDGGRCAEELCCRKHGVFYHCPCCPADTALVKAHGRKVTDVLEYCEQCSKAYCIRFCWQRKMVLRETTCGWSDHLAWVCAIHSLGGRFIF